MKYSLSYQCSGWKDVDEVQCPYNQLGLIIHDVKPEQRVCILMPKDASIDKVIEQTDLVRKVVGDNYTIRCDSMSDLRQLLNRGYKAWLFTPVTDWETYQVLVDSGVSDVLIDGYLGFCGRELSWAKEDYPIIHRASPCVSPTHTLSDTSSSNFFFIRPEDQHLYEGSIDILSPIVTSHDREQVIINIYKLGSYFGSIADLIQGVGVNVGNMLLDNRKFGETRFDCNQKCQHPRYRCRFCENTLNIADKLITIAKEYADDRNANDASQAIASTK